MSMYILLHSSSVYSVTVSFLGHQCDSPFTLEKSWKKSPLLKWNSCWIYRGGSRIPRRRGCQPSGRGRQPTILSKFSQKMHEIAKILGRRGRLLRSATDLCGNTLFIKHWTSMKGVFYWREITLQFPSDKYFIALIPFSRFVDARCLTIADAY